MSKVVVHIGPMGSGKSSALVNDYNEKYYDYQKVAFTSDINSRDGSFIKSRTQNPIKAVPINESDFIGLVTGGKSKIRDSISYQTRNVFFDELNFYFSEPNEEKGLTNENLPIVKKLVMDSLVTFALENDINLHFSGLSKTAEREPYGLMATAIHYGSITVHSAQCTDCGRDAGETLYIPIEKETNVPGADDYCAVCLPCHIKWVKMYDKYKKDDSLDSYYSEAKKLLRWSGTKTKMVTK